MKALVFAAGLGTRLKPITDTMPKALVQVCGVPMLERVICKLRDAGANSIVVNACHFAEQIQSFVREHDFGVNVGVSLEQGGVPLETGGGIRHAAPLLQGDRFLVHNVDILSDVDLRWFVSQDSGSSLATLLLRDVKADRYLLFDEGMRLCGWTNVVTGEVKSPYPDFDPSRYRRYSFCGIHMMSPEVFGLMESWPEHFGIIDFYLKYCREREICGVVAPEGMRLIDIGTPETLAAANALQL